MTTFKPAKYPVCQLVDFSVVQDLYRTPFPGQRSHKLHLAEAPYLRSSMDLWGDQLVFHSVRYQESVPGRKSKKGQHKLCDGYTRILAVLSGLKNMPDKVMLITHTVADYETAYALYCQFNSPQASKKGKHSVQSGVREATQKRGERDIDCFNSHLMLKGALTSGITHCGVPGADMRKKTSNAFASLEFLDKMGRTKTHETSGLMAAYIAIIERDRGTRPAQVRKFIRFMNQADMVVADTLADSAIVAAREYHMVRKAQGTTSGQRNVVTIRDRMLAYYQHYLDLQSSAKAVLLKDMDLAEFKMAA